MLRKSVTVSEKSIDSNARSNGMPNTSEVDMGAPHRCLRITYTCVLPALADEVEPRPPGAIWSSAGANISANPRGINSSVTTQANWVIVIPSLPFRA